MTKLNVAVYAEGCMYPSSADQAVSTTISQLQQSGFKSVILSLFHIGRDYDISPTQNMGDLYYNGKLIISEGSYVGDPTWPKLINTIIGGSVEQLCASIGGGIGVLDFQTIQRIYQGNGGSFNGTNLEKNCAVLKAIFPGISIIDMDCEDTYDQPSFVAFCEMLIGLGFGITFCPYCPVGLWIDALAVLNTTHQGAVKWWNLQCYDGGQSNDPSTWADLIKQKIPAFSTDGFILASDWTAHSPNEMQAWIGRFKKESCVGGAFIWTLDQIIEKAPKDPLALMKEYVDAITTALGNV